MPRQVVLFSALDASGNDGLWVTNGTAAGTHELTGISGAWAGPGGLDAFDFTLLDGEVLFGGRDASGNDGLWVTDGTAAGTHELTGISGAATGTIGSDVDNLSGLVPRDFTVLNGEALFA